MRRLHSFCGVTVVAVFLLCNVLGSTAHATTIKWTCKVGPNSWCEYGTAHDYTENVVINGASFDVISATKFIDPNNNLISELDGTISGSSPIQQELDLIDHFAQTATYPLVYNYDRVNTRTFTVYSIY